MANSKSLMEQLEPIMMPVKKVPAEAGELRFNKNLDHWVVVTDKNGQDIVVNSCSRIYQIVDNRELFTPLVETLANQYNMEAKVGISKSARFYVDLIVKDNPLEVISKDKIFPRIRLSNSYDGSIKYTYEFGFYRLVCTNGLTAPVGDTAKIKMKHSIGLGDRAVRSTVDSVAKFVDQSGEILKGYEDLASSKLSQAAAMKRIEEIIEETKYPKKQVEAVQNRLQTEINMGMPISDFLVYNALNHVLFLDDIAMREHKKEQVDQEVLQYITNY